MKPIGAIRLKVIPLTLKQANEYIEVYHRHHKKVQGHRFSIGSIDENKILHGVCVCGRPVARGCDQYFTLEVTRLATDGTPNICSKLYSSAAQIAKIMGFTKIQTYILEEEPGTSLLACGFFKEAETSGGSWDNNGTRKRRRDQPEGKKSRYVRYLNA